MDTFVEGVFPTLAALTSILLKLYSGQIDFAAAPTFFFWMKIGPPVAAGVVILLVLLIAFPFSYRSHAGAATQYTESPSPARQDSLQISDQDVQSSSINTLMLFGSETADDSTIKRRDLIRDKRRDKKMVTPSKPEKEGIIVANHDFEDSDDVDMQMVVTSFAVNYNSDDANSHSDDASSHSDDTSSHNVDAGFSSYNASFRNDDRDAVNSSSIDTNSHSDDADFPTDEAGSYSVIADSRNDEADFPSDETGSHCYNTTFRSHDSSACSSIDANSHNADTHENARDSYYKDYVPLELLPHSASQRETPSVSQRETPSVRSIENLSLSNHEQLYHSNSDNVDDSAYEIEALPREGVASIVSSLESDSVILPPPQPKQALKNKPWFMPSSPTTPQPGTVPSSPQSDAHVTNDSVNFNVNYKSDHVKQNGAAKLLRVPITKGESNSTISLYCDTETESRPSTSSNVPSPESTLSRNLKKSPNFRANLSSADFKVIEDFAQTMERVQSGMKQDKASQLQATIQSLERMVREGEGTDGSSSSVNFKQLG